MKCNIEKCLKNKKWLRCGGMRSSSDGLTAYYFLYREGYGYEGVLGTWCDRLLILKLFVSNPKMFLDGYFPSVNYAVKYPCILRVNTLCPYCKRYLGYLRGKCLCKVGHFCNIDLI
jgi:hypothetical protein